MRFNSYSVPAALALAVLVASVMDANALTIFDDGGTHTIDAGNATADMGVIVRDSSLTSPTTLNVVGGTVGVSTTAEFFGFSLLVEGSSSATMSGGTLLGHASTCDTAVLNISGGFIGGGVNALCASTSTVNITGGTIIGSVDGNDGGWPCETGTSL